MGYSIKRAVPNILDIIVHKSLWKKRFGKTAVLLPGKINVFSKGKSENWCAILDNPGKILSSNPKS